MTIDYRRTSVVDAATAMRARYGIRAGQIARNREDRTEVEACAAFWQRVELEIEKQVIADSVTRVKGK